MTRRIMLPPLPFPDRWKMHPHFDAEHSLTNRFEMATLAYADRFRMYDSPAQRARLAKIENSRLAALMYSKGSDELLQVGSDFVVWAFAFDDEYCDEGPLSNDPAGFNRKACEILRAIDSPQEPPCNDDRYAMAMRDIRQRLDRLAKPQQVARYTEMIRWYITSEMMKITNPRPTLSDFFVTRLYNGGGMAFPALVHIVGNVDLAQDEYEDQRARAMMELSAMLAILDAELYAYPKEVARNSNENDHNILFIFERDDHCTFDEAVQRYMEMRWRMISLFERLRKDVLQDASPAMREFVDGLSLYYHGTAMWSICNHRYGSISGLATNDVVVGGITHECPPESFESIGVQSCEWWWTHDPARREVAHQRRA
ncbi:MULTISPECIES: terpene synthase family protein [unclassified Variovorax]|uniref:terpene synthase family protein n=1 Tax=unclassified Variovorax TaxID=663243 RepID=UPI0032E65CEE